MTTPLNVDTYGLLHMAAKAAEEASYVSGVTAQPPEAGAVAQRTSLACNAIHRAAGSVGIAMSMRLERTAEAAAAAAHVSNTMPR